MDETHSKGKILRGTKGIGTVTPQMIHERAREIARTDGRAKPNDLDRVRAREELPVQQQARKNFRRRRNRVVIGKCRLSPRARKLRPCALTMMKTFPKNWFKKVSRRLTTISV